MLPHDPLSDTYTFEEFLEDSENFSRLLREQKARPRDIAWPYFSAHYAPEARAQAYLNRFWSVMSFVEDNLEALGIYPEEGGISSPDEETYRAAWTVYSDQPHNEGLEDAIAVQRVVAILVGNYGESRSGGDESE